MTITYWGMHVNQGSRNGWGDVAPHIAAICILNEYGALDEMTEPNCLIVLRDSTVYGDAPGDIDRTDYSEDDWFQAGRDYWYPKFKDRIATALAHVRIDKSRVFWQFVNETGGSNVQTISNICALERGFAEGLKADGWPCGVALIGIAGGDPDWNVWIDNWLPHITSMWQTYQNHVVYSRHAYGGVPQGAWPHLTRDGLIATENANRPFLEREHLSGLGCHIELIVTEAGQYGGTRYDDDKFIADMEALDRLSAPYKNLRWCMWTYGFWSQSSTGGQENIQRLSPQLVAYLEPRNVPKPFAIDAGPPPVTKPKIVIYKYPQEWPRAKWERAAALAFEEYKRTQTASHDDMLTMIGAGNSESYAVVWDAWEPSQQEAIQKLDEAGYAYQTRNLGTPPDPPGGIPDWRADYWPTEQRRITQPFGANPDYYGQWGLPGHEGLDIAANRGAPLYAIAAGHVYRVEHNDNSNYGIQVRIDHGNGFKSIYAHNLRNRVQVGQTVTAGQRIADADNTGNSHGDHLHLTLKYTGATANGWTDYPNDQIDPLPYIEGLPIPAEPDPEPPPGQSINTWSYMIADPQACRVVKHVDPNGHETNEEVWDIRTPEGWIARRKNDNGEWWQYKEGYAWLLFDTSPDPERMYVLTKNGHLGAAKNPQIMSDGQRWTEAGTHHVQFKMKNGCSDSDLNSGNATNYATLRHIGRKTFSTYGQNLTIDDVIELSTSNDEIQYYGRHEGKAIGWIGWRAPWGTSEIVELHWNRTPPGEPNRWCV